MQACFGFRIGFWLRLLYLLDSAIYALSSPSGMTIWRLLVCFGFAGMMVALRVCFGFTGLTVVEVLARLKA